MTPSMMSNMTWQITQTGNTFTGTMQFPGYPGAMMTVSGIVTGNTATFTMTMAGGGMMATCTVNATGTLDLNALMTEMHGTYSGSNTCSGPFNGGQMTMMRGNGTTPSTAYSSNGQRIYFTASSASGQPITHQGGPFVGMMTGELACVMCHQFDGHGGQVVMMGQRFQAPNITWPGLLAVDPPYTDATLKRAIAQGIDSGGGSLESPMPRWSMAESDLDDLVKYLKTLR